MPGGKRRGLWREIPVLVLIALVLALLVKTFVVQAFYIPSSSMEDTLLTGDKVLVSKVAFRFRQIQRGDIVVFNGAGSWVALPQAAPPSSNPVLRLYDATLRPVLRSVAGLFGEAPGQTDFVKRVIGVAHDHVACCNARGQLTVNGVAVQEKSYLYPRDTSSSAPPSYSGRFSVIVPAGRLWVLGDYRSVSDDSRLHTADPGNGTIPADEVIGRAFLIVWPLSRLRVLPIPATFSQPGISAAAPAGRNGSAPVPAAVPARPEPAGLAAAGMAAAGTAAPYLPLAAGFVGAVPVTWLQRRFRQRSLRQRRFRLQRLRQHSPGQQRSGAERPRRRPRLPLPPRGLPRLPRRHRDGAAHDR